MSEEMPLPPLPSGVLLSEAQFAQLLREHQVALGTRLIEYEELAERVELGVRSCRDLKAADIIHPAMNQGNTVRFHWPSVVQQLNTRKWRNKR